MMLVYFDQIVPGELGHDNRIVATDGISFQIIGSIFTNRIIPVRFQSAQLYWFTIPLISIEGKVHPAFFFQHMGFRLIISHIVKVQVVTSRNLLLIIYSHPLFIKGFFFRSEQVTPPDIWIVFRPCELRTNNATYTNLCPEIITVITQLNMVGIISKVIINGPVNFPFLTDLKA